MDLSVVSLNILQQGLSQPGGPISFSGEEGTSHRVSFQVGLWDRHDSTLFCGGSIISPIFILTAANCLYLSDNGEKPRRRPRDSILVVAGDYDISRNEGTEQVRRVDQIIAHNVFGHLVNGNDVALLRLDRPLDFGQNVNEIRVPRPDNTGEIGGNVTVSGWGASRWGFTPGTRRSRPRRDTLAQQRNLQIMNRTECQRRVSMSQPSHHRLSPGTMCCYSKSAAACYGDPGSPAYCKVKRATPSTNYGWGSVSNGISEQDPDSELVLCGIVSASSTRNCDPARNSRRKQDPPPEIFTDVAQHEPWIRQMAGLPDPPNGPPPDANQDQNQSPQPTTTPLPPSGVYCAKEKVYVPREFICDGEKDCADGVDEKECGPDGVTKSPTQSIDNKNAEAATSPISSIFNPSTPTFNLKDTNEDNQPMTTQTINPKSTIIPKSLDIPQSLSILSSTTQTSPTSPEFLTSTNVASGNKSDQVEATSPASIEAATNTPKTTNAPPITDVPTTLFTTSPATKTSPDNPAVADSPTTPANPITTANPVPENTDSPTLPNNPAVADSSTTPANPITTANTVPEKTDSPAVAPTSPATQAPTVNPTNNPTTPANPITTANIASEITDSPAVAPTSPATQAPTVNPTNNPTTPAYPITTANIDPEIADSPITPPTSPQPQPVNPTTTINPTTPVNPITTTSNDPKITDPPPITTSAPQTQPINPTTTTSPEFSDTDGEGLLKEGYLPDVTPPTPASVIDKSKYLLHLCQFRGGFVCPLDAKCVDKNAICDGNLDCPSGFDEDPIYCEFRRELMAQRGI